MRSKYETHIKPNLEAIKKMCESGVRLKDIAKAIGVAPSTLHAYQSKHSELSELFKKAKEVLDSDMLKLAEDGLKAKLTGRWQETKRTTYSKLTKEGELVTWTDVEEKWLEPDTTAIIFTLKSKAPITWNRAEHDITLARRAKVEAETERIKNGSGIDEDLAAALGEYVANG